MIKIKRRENAMGIQARMIPHVYARKVKKGKSAEDIEQIYVGNNVKTIRLMETCCDFCKKPVCGDTDITPHPFSHVLSKSFFNITADTNKFSQPYLLHRGKIDHKFVDRFRSYIR